MKRIVVTIAILLCISPLWPQETNLVIANYKIDGQNITNEYTDATVKWEYNKIPHPSKYSEYSDFTIYKLEIRLHKINTDSVETVILDEGLYTGGFNSFTFETVTFPRVPEKTFHCAYYESLENPSRVLYFYDTNSDNKYAFAVLELTPVPNKPEVVELLHEAGDNFENSNYLLYRKPWDVLTDQRAPISFYERLLAMGVKVDFASDYLKGAINEDYLDAVDFFIKQGADVNYEDENKKTPLHEAAMKKNPDIINSLIKAGADANKKNIYGWTPLHYIFTSWSSFSDSSKMIESINILLSHGSDINAKAEDGTTALMLASRFISTRPEVVQAILRGNPDINAVNDEGKSALILAAENVENPAIITILLNAGANAKLEDNTGRTALDWFDMNKWINRSPARKALKDRMR